jgi:hypothetical protein
VPNIVASAVTVAGFDVGVCVPYIVAIAVTVAALWVGVPFRGTGVPGSAV